MSATEADPVAVTGHCVSPSPYLANCLAQPCRCPSLVALLRGDGDADVSSFSSPENSRKVHPDERIFAQAWSPDGDIFGVACNQRTILYAKDNLCDVLTVQSIYFRPVSMCISCSRQGERTIYLIAVGGADGVHIFMYEKVKISNEEGSFQLKELEDLFVCLHESIHICVVQFSPDGRYLAVAAMDSHVGIWRIRDDLLFDVNRDMWFSFMGSERITDLAFSHQSEFLAVVCWDESILMFNRLPETEGKQCWKRQNPLIPYSYSTTRCLASRPPCLCSFSPNGKFLVVASDGRITFSSRDTGEVLLVHSGEFAIKGLAVDPRLGVLAYTRSRVWLSYPWPAVAAWERFPDRICVAGIDFGSSETVDLHVAKEGLETTSMIELVVTIEVKGTRDGSETIPIPFLELDDVLPYVDLIAGPSTHYVIRRPWMIQVSDGNVLKVGDGKAIFTRNSAGEWTASSDDD